VSSANIVVVATHAESLTEQVIDDKLEKLRRRILRAFAQAFKFAPFFACFFDFFFCLTRFSEVCHCAQYLAPLALVLIDFVTSCMSSYDLT
jgi:hypothetical protein